MMHHDAEHADTGLYDDSDSNPLIEKRDLLTGSETTTSIGDQDRMQLREKEVHARKTATETGEVRLGKEVVTEQRTVDVPITREEVLSNGSQSTAGVGSPRFQRPSMLFH